jgi:hypothetical protein
MPAHAVVAAVDRCAAQIVTNVKRRRTPFTEVSLHHASLTRRAAWRLVTTR